MPSPITKKGYDALKAELDRLRKVERPQVIEAIAEARAHGDLSENAEYDAAKERQGFIEARIAEIETKLADARVVEIAGRSSETVVFGAGCGGTCDLRTITLAGGSIIAEETASGGACPAGDVCRPGPLELGSGTLTDVIVGGTGVYEGASGTLTGTVKLAVSNRYPAGTSIVKLSGTIHYDP